jgi:hypothetical protein
MYSSVSIMIRLVSLFMIARVTGAGVAYAVTDNSCKFISYSFPFSAYWKPTCKEQGPRRRILYDYG